MERNKSITIEPYIEQGGQLGEKIELNEPVAQGFMKRADLRRDVVVRKGDELPQRSTVEMRDELAFKGTASGRDLFSKKISTFLRSKAPPEFLTSEYITLIIFNTTSNLP